MSVEVGHLGFDKEWASWLLSYTKIFSRSIQHIPTHEEQTSDMYKASQHGIRLGHMQKIVCIEEIRMFYLI
jgi:hypothetical protein